MILVYEVDGVDAKILKNLLYNGREGFVDIARECGVSTNAVRKRFLNMEGRGIIVGATIQADYESLGYPALVTVLLNVESQHVASSIERLKKIPNVLVFRQFNSRYSIRLIARMRNLKELDRIKEAIRLHNSVIDFRTFFWLGVKNIPENLSFNISENTAYPVSKTPAKTFVPRKTVSLDELDHVIAQKLSENGRMSFRKISEEMGTSTDTVIRRYQRLLDNGALKVSIQINPEKLGYQANLDFSIAFAFQKETAAIVENLAKIPNIIIILKTSGDYDLHVTAMVRNTEEQFRIQEEIAKIPNIARMETAARRIPDKWPTPIQHISTF